MSGISIALSLLIGLLFIPLETLCFRCCSLNCCTCHPYLSRWTPALAAVFLVADFIILSSSSSMCPPSMRRSFSSRTASASTSTNSSSVSFSAASTPGSPLSPPTAPGKATWSVTNTSSSNSAVLFVASSLSRSSLEAKNQICNQNSISFPSSVTWYLLSKARN